MILRSCDYVLRGSTISQTIEEKAKSSMSLVRHLPTHRRTLHVCEYRRPQRDSIDRTGTECAEQNTGEWAAESDCESAAVATVTATRTTATSQGRSRCMPRVKNILGDQQQSPLKKQRGASWYFHYLLGEPVRFYVDSGLQDGLQCQDTLQYPWINNMRFTIIIRFSFLSFLFYQ